MPVFLFHLRIFSLSVTLSLREKYHGRIVRTMEDAGRDKVGMMFKIVETVGTPEHASWLGDGTALGTVEGSMV